MSDGLLFDVPPDLLARYRALQQRRREQAKVLLGRYYDDPAAFAHDCIDWPDGESLATYQDEALDALAEHHRVSVRSLHGVGKTTTEAMAILWFTVTREAMARDWKCITTAGAWNQLENYLWPEVHKWARRLRWDRLLRDPFKNTELMKITMALTYGRASAVSPANHAFLEGAHADSIFYVFDESKAIPVETWDAAEGAFSTEGNEGKEAFALSCSTPGEPIGRFFEIQSQKAGYEDWHVIHIGLAKALEAGRVSRTWATQREKQWGADSALYANRVLGEFHSSDEDAVIPLSWIEAAVERYKDSTLAMRDPDRTKRLARPPLTAVGVDVARFGDDQSAISLIHGHRVEEIRRFFHEPTPAIAGRAAGAAGEASAGVRIVVDTDGVGGGVTDQLRERDYEVVAFHGGYATERKDRSGELGFKNWRSAAWWNMRELLDPHPCSCAGTAYCEEHGSKIELPDDALLLGDLAAPRVKKINDKSQIEVEPKAETKKRLGRSPDSGDSVIMPFFPGDRPRRKRRMVAAGRMGSAGNPG